MNNKHYAAFCSEMCTNFDKSWSKEGKQLEYVEKYLSHIPDHAWEYMASIAMNTWERWPSSWVKAVNNIYEIWRKDAPVMRQKTKVHCDDCGGQGYFSAIDLDMRSYTILCKGCQNWRLDFGQWAEESNYHGYPMEFESDPKLKGRFQIVRYPVIDAPLRRRDINSIYDAKEIE